jgi:hypothetical protein
MSPITLTLLLALGCAKNKDEDGDGVVAAEDCDDHDAQNFPGNTEVCDGQDNDCDDDVDDEDGDLDPADGGTWYLDGDGDGFGAEAIAACAQPEDTVDDDTDCDDNDSDVFPGADELCNGEDDDCDGEVDEPDAIDAETWYPDLDGDGYGDSTAGEPSCEAPTGWIADGTDCDDALAEINPGAIEICNGLDDDCDAGTPEAGLAHFLDATGAMTDLSTAMMGSPGSPALVELHEDGELVVCEGDWFVGLDVQASVDILGVGDPAAIVLDGGGSTTPVLTITGDALEVGLIGLTLSNGVAEVGAAAHCTSTARDSTLSMTSVTVDGFGDTATSTYGAVYLEGCNSVFDRVELSNNEGAYYAALLGYYGDHDWRDVEVFGNTATQAFGAGYVSDASLAFDEVSFTDNEAGYAVGALGVVYSDLIWTGSESTSSGLTGNTDASEHYGALFLYDTTAAFADVDFGTSAGGDDNRPADLYVSDINARYMAEDDETFSCDSEGCGSPDTYEVSGAATYNDYHPNGYAFGDVYLADAGDVTLSGFDVYGYGDSSCDLDYFVATNTALTTTGWTAVWTDGYEAPDHTSADGWNEAGPFGVVVEDGLYYAIGYGVRSCSAGGFYANFEYASSNDGGIGDAVGYVVTSAYSYFDVSSFEYAESAYTAPWTQRIHVTDL